MVQSIILTGPTAVGKTKFALEVSSELGMEIINADSVCFYQHFNIGSAKPSSREQALVRHHLIDVAHPDERYHAGQFLRDFETSLRDIHARGKRALIVGGSGFYLKALRYGLWDAPATSPEFRKSLDASSTEHLHQRLLESDPVQSQRISISDRYRIVRALEILHLSGKKPSELEASMSKTPRSEFSLWVVDREKSELEMRMRSRIDAMLRSGWIDETRSLLDRFPHSKTLGSVGYLQIVHHLHGVLPKGRKIQPGLPGLTEEILLAHRQLAKQQRTWFKSLSPEAQFILDSDEKALKEKLMRFYQ